jgi:hypothetical protein
MSIRVPADAAAHHAIAPTIHVIKILFIWPEMIES